MIPKLPLFKIRQLRSIVVLAKLRKFVLLTSMIVELHQHKELIMLWKKVTGKRRIIISGSETAFNCDLELKKGFLQYERL